MNNIEILIVDDDPCGRKLLASYLRPKGYDVIMASSGEEALELANSCMPAVVLLDVMMPGMSGLEVCRTLKADPRTRLTQIMMVTALGDESDLVDGLDMGADDYIAKPVPKAEFLAKVRALVRARTLMQELEHARQALENKNRELDRKRTLAQALVHDLRNPLTSVVGSLDLMGLKESFRNELSLKRARNGATRMSRMISDLLDVDCLEDGNLAPDLQEHDLNDLLQEAADAHQSRSSQQGVRLYAQLGDAPCIAEADSALILRVLDNLIVNALAYSSEGMEVSIAVSQCAEGIKFAVADQGPGVPEERQQDIFEKYSRVEKSDAGDRKNRGLGLTFCQLAVEAHGGTIWVEDGLDGGALFQFLLPALATPEALETETSNFVMFPAQLSKIEDRADRVLPLAGAQLDTQAL
jgi:signal transduction histidine kinase